MQGYVQFSICVSRFVRCPGYLSEVNLPKKLTQSPLTQSKSTSNSFFFQTRTTSPFPIRFTSLSVSFNNPNYNSICAVNVPGSNSSEAYDEGDLYLEPRKIKKLTFTFTPFPEDVGKHIEVLFQSYHNLRRQFQTAVQCVLS